MEVRSLQLVDIDLNRRMLHIRQSKGKKDRYVPIGAVLTAGLQKYIDDERPVKWLFNGKGDPAIEVSFGSYTSPYLCHAFIGSRHRYYDHSKTAGS